MKTFKDNPPMLQQRLDAWVANEQKIKESAPFQSLEENRRNLLLQRWEAIRASHDHSLAAMSDQATVAAAGSFAKSPDAENAQPTSAMPPTHFSFYVAPWGHDTNSGTQAAPFRTIQRAIDAGGGQIKLEDGTYDGFTTLSGLNVAEVFGNVNNPEAVVINGNTKGTVIASGSSKWGLDWEFIYLALHGMTITGGSSDGNQMVIEAGSILHLQNVIITGNSSNRAIIGVADLTHHAMIHLRNTLIYNNQVHTSGRGTVSGKDELSVAFIDNVTIVDNVAPVTIHNDGHVSISNSILRNPLSAVEVKNTAVHAFASIGFSNIRNSAMLTGSNFHIGQGILDVDPMFVSPANGMYQLADNSPCIDAGAPWSSDAHRPPAKGTLRTDMGAYGGPYVSSQLYQIDPGPDPDPEVNPTEGSVAEYSYNASGNRIKRRVL